MTSFLLPVTRRQILVGRADKYIAELNLEEYSFYTGALSTAKLVVCIKAMKRDLVRGLTRTHWEPFENVLIDCRAHLLKDSDADPAATYSMAMTTLLNLLITYKKYIATHF